MTITLKAISSLYLIDMTHLAATPQDLVPDFQRHLHAGVNRAEDLQVTGLVERHRCRMTRSYAAEIEDVARRRGQHIVNDVVVVEKYERVALLDFQRGLREHLALLTDGALGRERNARPGDEREHKSDFQRLHGCLLYQCLSFVILEEPEPASGRRRS